MTITAQQFDAFFDAFRSSVYRLEALPAYDVGEEDEDFDAWRAGKAQPERSVRTSPWLARIAVSTAVDGKHWSRTRILDDPLTEYERFELPAYAESQACGDQTRLAWRRDVGEVGPDFWLFDADLPDTFAIVMLYDERGCWQGAERVDDPAQLAELVAIRDRVEAASVSYNEFVAGRSCSR